MKLQDSDIISAARDLRDEQNQQFNVAPSPIRIHRRPTPLWWAATAAALVVGFVLGKAPVLAPAPQEQTAPSLIGRAGGESVSSSKDDEGTPAIIREVIHEVVHDTIYETRIVRMPVQQTMTAQAEPAPSTPGCSMLCDDIRYDLLTGN